MNEQRFFRYLRERLEDIPLLVEHFLKRFHSEYHSPLGV